MSRHKPSTFVHAGALAVLIVAAGCGHKEPRAASTVSGPPATVQIVRAVPPRRGASLILPGRVKAVEEITVMARVGARLTAMPFHEGDAFKKGQTLAAFDSPETRQTVESARSAVSSATIQRDQARRQEARMDSLYRAGVASVRQLELAQADRKAADAGLAQAQAAASQWEENTAISVPFDGVVVRRHVDPGASVGPGQPLLDVRSQSVGEIEAAVPESELGRLQAGRASYQVGDGPWRPAELIRVDGATDFTTRTRVARFRPADGHDGLEPGAFTRLRLDGGDLAAAGLAGGDPPAGAQGVGAAGAGNDVARAATDARLSIPNQTLVHRGSLTGVYVIRDHKAYLRWLRVGREEGGAVEVLAGLDADDAVALNPDSLWDGRPVEVAR